MTSTLRLAVFDVDGTIVDSQHNIVASMTLACEQLGLTAPTANEIRRIIGLSLLEAVETLLPDIGPDMHRAVVEGYKDGFRTLRMRMDHQEPLFPGAVECFDRLAEDGWLLAVATGKSLRGLLAMIERHGLEGRFVSLQTADDNPGKPHPAMLRRALAEAGVAGDGAVMIGDTSYDMIMARDAGTRAIGVAWGYHAPQELLNSGAERVVESYQALTYLLCCQELSRP
jgi:phosphoglycolate phosphatase